MISGRHKTSLFVGSNPLLIKISIIAMLSLLVGCGSDGDSNSAAGSVAETIALTDKANEAQAEANVVPVELSTEDQPEVLAGSDNEVQQHNNIWGDTAWDTTVWTPQAAAQSENWNNDSWSETLWQ